MTDKKIIKALERLKNTKDYLKEQYKEQVKKCPYPELKPIAKQTYEDNKNAFDIAIKAIEEFNRQKAEIERLKAVIDKADAKLGEYEDHFAEKQADVVMLNKEIISLQELCETKTALLTDANYSLLTAKAEAIKEFAERLCEDRVSNDPVVIAAKTELKMMQRNGG